VVKTPENKAPPTPAVYLSMPEVENHRRSLNVKAGIRLAFKEGRYVMSPPKGYIMGRDSSKKNLF
jgi:site-specific DNA recombinase